MEVRDTFEFVSVCCGVNCEFVDVEIACKQESSKEHDVKCFLRQFG